MEYTTYLTVMGLLVMISLGGTVSIWLQNRRCRRHQKDQHEELGNVIRRHTEDLDDHIKICLAEKKHIKHLHEMEDSINREDD